MNNKKLSKILSIILTVCLLFTSSAAVVSSFAESGENEMPEIKQYGFIDSDGVKLEYGIYGVEDGEPLLLLSPNGNDMHAFDSNILPEMAKHYKVITVSVRGTGKSERGPVNLNFETESSDLVNILDALNIETVNIFGFSDGGNLGIIFTLEHQDRVRRLSIMGANINTFGTKTFNQIGIIFEYFFLCIKADFEPTEENKNIRDIQGMMVKEPTLSFKDLNEIKVPTLNIFGEHDMIKRLHSKQITKSIPGAKELMVKGGGHSSCFDQTKTVLNPALLDFFGSGK